MGDAGADPTDLGARSGATISDVAPQTQPSAMSPYRDGTGAIIAATALTALAVYLFQVIVGRSLGVEGFAPLGVLWTISFMVFTVLYLPVEQYVTRRLILGGGQWRSDQRSTGARF